MATMKHIRGDTWLRAWIYGGLESPIDITGASARLHLRTDKDVLVLSASTAGDYLTMTPLEGRIDLVVPAEKMSELVSNETYLFDLELTLATGIVKTLEQGKLKISKDYTYG